MKIKFGNNKGQSILEVILAVAIFALIGVTLSSMILGSFNSLTRSVDMTKAQALLDEAVEAVKSIKGGAWNKMVYNRSAVTTNSNEWIFNGEGSSQVIDEYTRTIDFEDVCRDSGDNIIACPGAYTDIHTKKAVVTIEWEIRPGVNNSIERDVYLSNWDSGDWAQNDWTGGGGQSVWSDDTRYDHDDGNINNSDSGGLRLNNSVAGCGVKTWHFNSSGNYNFDNNKIEVVSSKTQIKTSDDDCLGSATDCTNFSDQPTCSNQFGCFWAPGSCGGSANSCSVLSSSDNCGTCGCGWTQGLCSNNGNCNLCVDTAQCSDCSCASCGWGGASCPWVEAWNGEKWIKEHEAFPFAIFRSVKNTTYDSLPSIQCIEGEAKVRIYEGLQEKTYLEDFNLYKTESDGFVKPDLDGRVRVIKNWTIPDQCSTSNGINNEQCLSMISEYDSVFFEPKFNSQIKDDYLELTFKDLKNDNPKLYLVVRKQAFLTTYYQYMVHIMGEKQFSIFDKISNWPIIRQITKKWWNDNLRVQIEVWDGKKWRKQNDLSAGLHMPGSGADDFLISLKKIDRSRDNLKVRMRFITGGFGIDYVALDDSVDEELDIKEIKPQKIIFNNNEVNDFNIQLEYNDYVEMVYKCNENDDLFFSISGHYNLKDFDEKREKDTLSAWSEFIMFFLGGKEYTIRTAQEKGLFKKASSLSDFSYEEILAQKKPCVLAYLIIFELVLILLVLILLVFKINKKYLLFLFAIGTILIGVLIYKITFVQGGGACSDGGSLLCNSCNEIDCNVCTQCLWIPDSCSGVADDCSIHNNQTDCSVCGCSWLSGSCDGAVDSCESFDSNQGSCESQSGCSWIPGVYFTDNPSISPNNTHTVSSIDYWSSFSENATKNGGEIYYQLSSDDGLTWDYWNGSGWVNASPTDYNI
ncbi:hypothetical protein K8R62_02290, partial [bacterium]|nr:hypothetical protein [bacterium]